MGRNKPTTERHGEGAPLISSDKILISDKMKHMMILDAVFLQGTSSLVSKEVHLVGSLAHGFITSMH